MQKASIEVQDYKVELWNKLCYWARRYWSVFSSSFTLHATQLRRLLRRLVPLNITNDANSHKYTNILRLAYSDMILSSLLQWYLGGGGQDWKGFERKR
jgi:hypothetical protein